MSSEKPIIGVQWVTNRGNQACTQGDCPIEAAVQVCPQRGWLETVGNALFGIAGLRHEGRLHQVSGTEGVFRKCWLCKNCPDGSLCVYQGQTHEAVKAAMDND